MEEVVLDPFNMVDPEGVVTPEEVPEATVPDGENKPPAGEVAAVEDAPETGEVTTTEEPPETGETGDPDPDLEGLEVPKTKRGSAAFRALESKKNEYRDQLAAVRAELEEAKKGGDEEVRSEMEALRQENSQFREKLFAADAAQSPQYLEKRGEMDKLVSSVKGLLEGAEGVDVDAVFSGDAASRRAAANAALKALNDQGMMVEAQQLTAVVAAHTGLQAEADKVLEDAKQVKERFASDRSAAAARGVELSRQRLAEKNPVFREGSPERNALPEETRKFYDEALASAAEEAGNVLSMADDPSELVANAQQTIFALRVQMRQAQAYQEAFKGAQEKISAFEAQIKEKDERIALYEGAVDGQEPGSSTGGSTPPASDSVLDPANMSGF